MPRPSFFDALQRLRNAVAALPSTVPIAHPSGIVYRNFKTRPSELSGDLWPPTAKACARCFDDNPKPKRRATDNVLRGQYGMDCVVNYFNEIATLPGQPHASLSLIEQRLDQITSLVHEKIRLVAPISGESTNAGTMQTVALVASDPEHEANDRTYIPNEPEDFSHLMSDEDNTDDESNHEDGNTNEARKAHQESEIEGFNMARTRPGPSDFVRRWVFSNFSAPVAGQFLTGKLEPAWVFRCKHCGTYRRVPRTPGCEVFKYEPRPIASTNLASHLRNQCKKIPQAESWMAAQARNQQTNPANTPSTTQQSLGSMFASETPLPPPPPTALSPTIFRCCLIQGVVRDTYSLGFGEGAGMIQVFSLVNPLVSLPSHQTMRRDLDKLYDILSGRVGRVMLSQNSRASITCDAWSSKSSKYSLAGVVTTFIDKSWTLQEFVLDVVHLAGDHAGKAMGKKIFSSLDRRHAARNLIASVTDNGSNNRTMNKEISKRVAEEQGYSMNPKNMSLICVCHVFHLVCSAILESLDIIQITEQEDGYDIAKAFDLSKPVEDSEDIREEEARIRRAGGNRSIWVPAEESGDDHSDSDAEEELDNEGSDGARNTAAEASTTPSSIRKQPQNALNPPQKIHAIAVNCTASPQRRMKMGEFIRLYCAVILAVITSMGVRWNTVLAELRRALLLRPAFEHWVNTLDTGKTGKARRVAQNQKRKWAMSDAEWSVIEELIQVLEPFEQATLSFSKKGKVHLPNVLPTFVQLRSELQVSRERLQKTYGRGRDPYGLLKAISAGEAKLGKYFDLARESHLPLIASILHPGNRLRFFENSAVWGDMMQRGRALIEHLFETYKIEAEHESTVSRKDLPIDQQPDRPKLERSSWSDKLRQLSSASSSAALDDELLRFFGNIYAYRPGMDVLQWWKEHEHDFPILSRIARDYLGIPATSVSVERLFSRCRLVMSDYRTMSVETARRIITCQQWLQAGLGVNLPNFVSGDQDEM